MDILGADLMLLNRDQILAAQDIAWEDVDVPEWSGSVRVRGLTGEERDAYEATILKMRGTNAQLNLANARAKLAQRSMVGEDGALLFSESDIAALARKSAAALERVFDVAQRLSGLRQADIEEMTKNSVAGRNGGSGSD